MGMHIYYLKIFCVVFQALFQVYEGRYNVSNYVMINNHNINVYKKTLGFYTMSAKHCLFKCETREKCRTVVWLEEEKRCKTLLGYKSRTLEKNVKWKTYIKEVFPAVRFQMFDSSTVEEARLYCNEMGFQLASLDDVAATGALGLKYCANGLVVEGYEAKVCPNLVVTKDSLESKHVWCKLP